MQSIYKLLILSIIAIKCNKIKDFAINQTVANKPIVGYNYTMLIGKREKISENQNRKLETFAIIALIVFAVISYLITTFVFKKNSRDITITVNGERITQVNGRRIGLNMPGTYTIGDPNGDYNILEIKDHKIRCIDANCPDKICVSHSYLNPEIDNDMIVCAPHGLVVQYQ